MGRSGFLAALLYLLLTTVALSINDQTMHKTASLVRTVAVVGGTHGNEYTGVFCIKALERQMQKGLRNYPFQVSTLIGNPEAYKANRRFMDQDLNRQFSGAAMAAVATSMAANPAAVLTAEQRRATEIDSILGPKFGGDGDERIPPAMDFIIDLHTTTTNMGTTLIVGQGDPLTTQAAAYVMHECRKKNFDVCILIHTHASQEARPNLASIAPHSFSIEVGPVPQGVLRHDKVEEMQEALNSAMEFLHRHEQEPAKLLEELKESYPSGRIPCYRSAPALRKGEMSAKLVWPSDPDNENFPQWLVHKNVQDKDFTEIETGDPLFVNLDGEVIPYDGSHGSPILLMFVNEGGYYYASSGTGISVAQRDEFDLITGTLIPKDTCEK
jgi:succinylglutamate desuccinylase